MKVEVEKEAVYVFDTHTPDLYKPEDPEHALRTAKKLVALLQIAGGYNSHFHELNYQLGSFPEKEDLARFMAIAKSNRDFICIPEEAPKKKPAPGGSVDINALMKENTGKLFDKYDKNNNGLSDFDEFKKMTQDLGLNLTRDQLLWIFSQSSPEDNAMFLTKDQFFVAFRKLKLLVIREGLEKLNLSDDQIVKAIVVFILLLFLVFAFIFTGIAALSSANPFSSIINSGMTVSTGMATLKGSMKKEYVISEEQLAELVREAIEEVNEAEENSK